MSEEIASDNPQPEPESNPETELHGAADTILGLMGSEDEPESKPEKETEKEEAEPAAKEEDKAEPEAKAEPAEPAEEPEFEVTIDGSKVKVKQSELLNGYQRQQDSTKKWQEAAQMRQEAEAKVQKTTTEYGQQLQHLIAQVESAVQSGNLAPPDPTLIDTDPVSFLKQKAQWENAQYAYQQAQTQKQQLQAQEHEAKQRQFAEHLATEREQLLAKLPSWKDETRMRAERKELTDYLTKAGYDPAEVGATADHRAVVLAHKAMQFDKLIAEQKAVVKNKVPAPQPKTAKPGAVVDEGSSINRSAMQRLRKSGSLDDAQAAIASLMGG